MVTIGNVRSFITAPAGINLVVVKVETSEPGLYGLGCATFTQRALAVKTAIDEYLNPLLAGREVDRIEELWHLMMVHSYWRNGPVLNNAVAGVDMALWDVKGKRAGMPVYELLGGKVREAAGVYLHAAGAEPKEIEDRVHFFREQGVRHVRVQCGEYGGARHEDCKPEGALEGAYYHPGLYMRSNYKALEHVRATFGADLEICHDVHERLAPSDAVQFAKQVEALRLLFLEDALAPEDSEWLANIRRACTTPLAMGELFVNPREWVPLITGRQIDFMRMHVSDIGGITPARKAAVLGELHGVRTAWHGPGDLTPIGHAANLHLDLVSPNFGVQEFLPGISPTNMTQPQEFFSFHPALREVFPGCPELRKGYLYPNDKPGLGVDFDEKAAARYPHVRKVDQWTQARRPDGCITRP